MKKAISLAIVLGLIATVAPAYAGGNGEEQVKNVQSGSRNVGTGWVEVMDSTHSEMSKGKGAGEQMTGLVAGGAIGARRAIHRMGAGAIDLLTFWIPKKQPLISPEQPRLQ